YVLRNLYVLPYYNHSLNFGANNPTLHAPKPHPKTKIGIFAEINTLSGNNLSQEEKNTLSFLGFAILSVRYI
ncbi:MAG: hypothetical protein IKZ11_04535, partial [Alistipes sp.]|nr:hypothetical protein [Alistipes sp.]